MEHWKRLWEANPRMTQQALLCPVPNGCPMAPNSRRGKAWLTYRFSRAEHCTCIALHCTWSLREVVKNKWTTYFFTGLLGRERSRHSSSGIFILIGFSPWGETVRPHLPVCFISVSKNLVSTLFLYPWTLGLWIQRFHQSIFSHPNCWHDDWKLD